MTDETLIKLMKKTMAEMLLENNKRLTTAVDTAIKIATLTYGTIGS